MNNNFYAYLRNNDSETAQKDQLLSSKEARFEVSLFNLGKKRLEEVKNKMYESHKLRRQKELKGTTL